MFYVYTHGCKIDILLKVRAKDPDALRFFQEKYRLVQMIATLQTPYITILDGYARKHCWEVRKRGEGNI